MNQTVNKKSVLREHFLEYARIHAVKNRIPTVRELRQALDVSSYMLLNCMNDLIREGVLYRKSRKEGTYLATRSARIVIGLLLNGTGRNDYLEQPPWMAGFCRAFVGRSHFFIRLLSLSQNVSLEEQIRQFDLKAVVVHRMNGTKNIFPDDLPDEVRNRIIFSFCEQGVCFENLPKENTLASDRDYWPREYVREAVRRGCRRFVLLGKDDFVNTVMIDEMRKQGMEWSDDCRITNPARVNQTLEKLIRQYSVDAVRCGGAYESCLAEFFRKNPSFRPFLPVLDPVKAEEFFGGLSPAVHCSAIFEPLDVFTERLGLECGLRAIELAQTGKTFPSVRMIIKHRDYDAHADGNIGMPQKKT